MLFAVSQASDLALLVEYEALEDFNFNYKNVQTKEGSFS